MKEKLKSLIILQDNYAYDAVSPRFHRGNGIYKRFSDGCVFVFSTRETPEEMKDYVLSAIKDKENFHVKTAQEHGQINDDFIVDSFDISDQKVFTIRKTGFVVVKNSKEFNKLTGIRIDCIENLLSDDIDFSEYLKFSYDPRY